MSEATRRSAQVTDYLDSLTLQLRMRDMPPAQIAQSVAEVEAHVHDSGEDPRLVFGPADAYADALVRETGAGGRELWSGPWWFLRFTAFVAGCWLLRLFLPDVAAWSDTVALPWTLLVYLIVLGLLGALVSRWLLRPWVERQVAASARSSIAVAPRALVLGGLGTLLVGPMFLSQRGVSPVDQPPSPIAPVPVWIVVGALLVAASVAAEVRASRIPTLVVADG